MATRGIRVLITLPLLTALGIGLCIVGLRERIDPIVDQSVLARPDQAIQLFLGEVNRGEIADAGRRMSAEAPAVDLQAVSLRLAQRFGPPVLTSAETRRWGYRRAVVWSWTRTAAGHRYILEWQLVREQGQWKVRACNGLLNIAPDIPGVWQMEREWQTNPT